MIGKDGAAGTGVLIAPACISTHLTTGNSVWESATSPGIAALLVYVAYRLGRTARDELVGQAMAPTLQRDVHTFLNEQSEIDTVTDLLTMRPALGSVLVVAPSISTAGPTAKESKKQPPHRARHHQ